MKIKNLIATAVGALGISTTVGCNAQDADVKVLAPTEFKTALEQDSAATLLDVRTPEEFAEGHLKGAVLIDWRDETSLKEYAVALDKGTTTYVYCRSGNRSNATAKLLAKLGLKVVDMKGGIMAWRKNGLHVTTLPVDVFRTDKGRRVEITFIKHGTLMVEVDGFAIHVDPVFAFGTDYSTLPKADLLLVTHEHGDHYDTKAIEAVATAKTLMLSNGRVAEMLGRGEAMTPGQTRTLDTAGITVTATAAYNNSPGRDKFHPKGRDVGGLVGVDNLSIYIAGDTEDIPELVQLANIDIAFLPVNQPYTMTPAQCIRAIEMFNPRVVYPYHYGDTDLAPVVDHFNDSALTEVRIRTLQ